MSIKLNELTNRRAQSPLQKQRESNLDLLRAICAIFVVFEHFCESTANNAFGFSLESSMPAHVLLRLMYGVARTAVPVFFILSGYLSINSQKQKIGKVINLFIMTGFYAIVPYLASCIVGMIKGEYSIAIKSMIFGAFPKNYYLYLFCSLYAFSPYINYTLNILHKKQYLRLCLILFFLFSFWSTFINTIGSIFDNTDITGWYFTSRTGTSMGFNIANFAMLYIFGGYLKLYYKPKYKRDIWLSILVLLSSTCITTIGKIFFPKISKAFLYYDSVFVILAALAMVILFINIKVKSNKIITFMGMHTFGTFLIHGFVNGCLEKIITIESVVSKGFCGTLLGILMFVIGVYLLSLLLTSVLELIAIPINKKWKSTKLYNVQFWLCAPALNLRKTPALKAAKQEKTDQ